MRFYFATICILLSSTAVLAGKEGLNTDTSSPKGIPRKPSLKQDQEEPKNPVVLKANDYAKSFPLRHTGNPRCVEEKDGRITVTTDNNAFSSYQLEGDRQSVKPGKTIRVRYKITVQSGGKMSLGLLNTKRNGWYGTELILGPGTHKGNYERVVPVGETLTSLVFRNYHLGTAGQSTFTIEKLKFEPEEKPLQKKDEGQNGKRKLERRDRDGYIAVRMFAEEHQIGRRGSSAYKWKPPGPLSSGLRLPSNPDSEQQPQILVTSPREKEEEQTQPIKKQRRKRNQSPEIKEIKSLARHVLPLIKDKIGQKKSDKQLKVELRRVCEKQGFSFYKEIEIVDRKKNLAETIEEEVNGQKYKYKRVYVNENEEEVAREAVISEVTKNSGGFTLLPLQIFTFGQEKNWDEAFRMSVLQSGLYRVMVLHLPQGKRKMQRPSNDELVKAVRQWFRVLQGKDNARKNPDNINLRKSYVFQVLDSRESTADVLPKAAGDLNLFSKKPGDRERPPAKKLQKGWEKMGNKQQ